MVQLVALLEPPQDQGALLDARLLDQHLLEAPVQSWILLDAAAELLGGGGPDAAQVAAGQGRLEDAACITARALGAHHRVQLIDEQDHAIGRRPFRLAHLLEHRAQALLKLAAELSAGDQGPQVEADQAQALEGIGHLAGHDALGQQFSDGGLAHSGLADQHRIVLAAAREHLNQATDLGVAADHRIELTGPGCGGEIPTELFQCRGLLLQPQAVVILRRRH